MRKKGHITLGLFSRKVKTTASQKVEPVVQGPSSTPLADLEPGRIMLRELEQHYADSLFHIDSESARKLVSYILAGAPDSQYIFYSRDTEPRALYASVKSVYPSLDFRSDGHVYLSGKLAYQMIMTSNRNAEDGPITILHLLPPYESMPDIVSSGLYKSLGTSNYRTDGSSGFTATCLEIVFGEDGNGILGAEVPGDLSSMDTWAWLDVVPLAEWCS